ncbi:MAG: hypothetical protein RLZZ511_3743 [Cyanobacteriota bacterium]
MVIYISLELRAQGMGDHQAEDAATDRAADRGSDNWPHEVHSDRYKGGHDCTGDPGFPQFKYVFLIAILEGSFLLFFS